KVVLRSGDRLLSARMYTGWRTVWPGLAKNLVDTLGGPASALITAFIAVPLAWAAFSIPALDAVGCLGKGESTACFALAPLVRAREVERPRISMRPDPRQGRTHSSDGTEPNRGVSKGTALLALVLLAVFLYAVRWALLPFVVSAVGAYLCTPLIERLARHTRLPRLVF